jgi:uncharacterized protein (DUF1697 family)
MRSRAFIALLRGINVGGHNKIPMQELRALCEDLGFKRVASYIQSGNLVFESPSTRTRLEDALETAVEERFGVSVSVLVRPAKDWREYREGNPFPRAREKEPNRVMLVLTKQPPKQSGLEGLLPYAKGGERLQRVGDALWIHYKGGSGKSKLSPAVLERFLGSPATARNWRTVLKLEEMTRPA